MFKPAAAFAAFLLLPISPAFADCTFGLLSETTYPAGTNPGDIASGDFNHDGYGDLVIANRESSNASILLGTAAGTFGNATTIDLGSNTQYDVEVAHLDLDQNLDLIFATAGNLVRVFRGNGDGTFTAGDTEQVSQNTGDLVTGDFNGDGRTDVAATAALEPGFHLLQGTGSGELTGRSLNYIPSGPEAIPTTIASGDFDGDGKPDIVLGDWSGVIWIWFGNGDGTFERKADSITTVTNPDHLAFAVAAGDFNGDGYDDIAVGNRDPYGDPDNRPPLAVVLSNGTDRTFATPVNYGTLWYPNQMTATDIDGDGKIDLLVADAEAVDVFIGNGDGTFAQQVPYGGNSTDIALVDVDRDGGPDIAATHFTTGTVGVLQNTCGRITLTVTSSPNPSFYNDAYTVYVNFSASLRVSGTITVISPDRPPVVWNLSSSGGMTSSGDHRREVGTYEYTATYSGDSRFKAKTASLVHTVRLAPFGPPLEFSAMMDYPGRAWLFWYEVDTVQKYEVWRRSHDTSWVKIDEIVPPTNRDYVYYWDYGGPSASALEYKVRSVRIGDGALSDFTNDFTVSHTFTDSTVTAGVTSVKTVHLTEARDAANKLLILAGLPARTWTASTVMLASQFTELLAAINDARVALGKNTRSFTNVVAPGAPVRKTNIDDIRGAMQ
jgi:hypothetical protein